MSTEIPGLTTVLIYVAGTVLLLLILRVVVLWYWRINQLIGRLDTLIGLLRRAPWNLDPEIAAHERKLEAGQARSDMLVDREPEDRTLR
ncbi:MAG TPA: hypothetical protein VFL12_06890 [Thermoanaerobaculia bacterium]|nr:hypothetical protein [Thermoanaerobaculia bacterium]